MRDDASGLASRRKSNAHWTVQPSAHAFLSMVRCSITVGEKRTPAALRHNRDLAVGELVQPQAEQTSRQPIDPERTFDGVSSR
jgi:hypothetical protein